MTAAEVIERPFLSGLKNSTCVPTGRYKLKYRHSVYDNTPSDRTLEIAAALIDRDSNSHCHNCEFRQVETFENDYDRTTTVSASCSSPCQIVSVLVDILSLEGEPHSLMVSMPAPFTVNKLILSLKEVISRGAMRYLSTDIDTILRTTDPISNHNVSIRMDDLRTEKLVSEGDLMSRRPFHASKSRGSYEHDQEIHQWLVDRDHDIAETDQDELEELERHLKQEALHDAQGYGRFA